MKAIGEAAGGSINDVLLAACSAALRRYLAEIDKLPRKSLICSIPVALPREADGTGGNAISFANVRMGTDIADVRERFEAIRRSSAAGREYLKQMSGTALMDYTVLISSPQILTRIPGVGARVPPIYNVIVSNVPGPRRRLYFMGAQMEAYYPISALAHGQALNITVLSYDGGLYFGFTACADRVPSVQRLAVYTGEALDELEATFMRGKAKGDKPKTAKKPKSKSMAKSRAKAKVEAKGKSGARATPRKSVATAPVRRGKVASA
jgi:WS/DGAT/MGAT family acyltransferase